MAQPPPDGDFMDEDMELQLALALSLQETTAADLDSTNAAPALSPPTAAPPAAPQAAAPPPTVADLAALISQGLQAAQAQHPPPPPAPAAPPPPAPAAQPPAAADLISQLLQQFLAGQVAGGPAANQSQPQNNNNNPLAAAAAALGFGAPAGTASAPAPAHAGASRASAARGGPPLVATPLPGWAAKLRSWHEAGGTKPGVGASSVTLNGADAVAALCGHLGQALQVKVVADSASITGGALFLMTTASAGGGREVSSESLRGLLSSALLQRRVAPRERLQALHRIFVAPTPGANGSPASQAAVGAAVGLLRTVVAREALGLMRDDGADLYSDTGAHTAAFVQALAGGPSTMSEAFLEALVDAAAASPGGRDLGIIRQLVRDTVRSAFNPAATQMTDAGGFERPLVVLDRLTCTARMQQCMAALLLDDLDAVVSSRSGAPARALEQSCVLGPLLGASTMPLAQDALNYYKVTSPARRAFLETRGYPRNASAGATCRTVLQGMMARVQDGAGHIMLRLSRVKDGGLCREALLSWVAAVGRANGVRLAFGETQEMRNHQDLADFLAGGSDGFLLNVTGGCLRLAQPFVTGWLDLYRNGADPLAAAAGGTTAVQPPAPPRFVDLFEKHLRPEYYASQRHRLGDLSSAYNITGSRGAGGFTADDDPPSTAPPLLLQSDSVGGDGCPSFMADVFFLTQLLLHVGPVPTIHRRRALLHRFRTRYQHEMTGGAANGADGAGGEDGLDPSEMRASAGRDPWANPLATEMKLYDDCVESHVHEPLLADNLTAFAVLELDWVAWLVRGGAGPAKDVARLVPEWALGDALDWLTAILYGGRADLVAAKPIGVIMRALVTLLNAHEVLRSAMLQNKIVNLLLAMLASQIQNVQAREAHGLALAPDRMSTGERALVGAVLGAQVTRTALIPALLAAHVNAELVVGLDVDKDAYDKYGMRYHIDKIVEELIKDNVLKRCLVDLAAASSSTSPSARTSSSSLPSTSTGAAAGGGAAAAGGSSAANGRSLPNAGSGDVEPGLFADYASGIVNTVMHYFKDALDRLADIYALERSKSNTAAWAALPPEERQRKEDFYRGQQRAAGGFLRMGVANLKWLITLTADPSLASAFLVEPLLGKTAFLVVSCLELLLGDACKKLQVSKPEQYGFDLPVLAGSVLSLMLQLARYEAFVGALTAEPDYSEEIMSRALQHLESSHQAALETRLRAFMTRAAELKQQQGPGGSGAAPRRSGVVEGGAAAGENQSPDTPPLKRRKSGDGMVPEPSSSNAAQGPPFACDAVQMPASPLSNAEVEARYTAELGPLSVAEYDSTVPGGYFKEMARLADQDSGASRKKMRQLARELSDMQPGGRLALPCLAAAAIFLRQDGARTDKMRAVITGPEGTPYEGGLFVFDIFCPAGYPNEPPVMMVYNTGGGKARYNPNLYADGKVCLSLLGTYNSGHASEKWNPAHSSLYQVLVSIQSQILVRDPMTNEPLSETMAGTTEGAAKTAEYNARLQLLVMRHAMVDMLRHPPPGTADIVTTHFRLLRNRLAATVRSWVAAAPTPDLMAKLDEQATKLLALLAEL